MIPNIVKPVHPCLGPLPTDTPAINQILGIRGPCVPPRARRLEDAGEDVDTTRRSPRHPRTVDPDFDELMPYTGLYAVYMYHDALQHECWRMAGLSQTGRLRNPTISFVPPPCAMMYLSDLSDLLGIEHQVIDEKGSSNIVYRIPFLRMQPVGDVCAFQELSGKFGFRHARLHKVHGAMHVIGELAVEYLEGRAARSCVSRIEFVITVWKLQPNGDLRPGIEKDVPVAKYMQVAASMKQLVREWPHPQDIHPDMRRWGDLPLVQPVTRPGTDVVALGEAPVEAGASSARIEKLRKLRKALEEAIANGEKEIAERNH